LNLLHLYLAPPLGVIPLEFRIHFWQQDTSPWTIVWRCLRDSTFSRFDTIPACDRRMDRQTHDDSTYRARVASRGNNTNTNNVSIAPYGPDFRLQVLMCKHRQTDYNDKHLKLLTIRRHCLDADNGEYCEVTRCKIMLQTLRTHRMFPTGCMYRIRSTRRSRPKI